MGCVTIVADGEGLLFTESLVVCTAVVGDAGAGVFADEGVGFIGDDPELADAAEFEAEAAAEAPVPTGTFCRYCSALSNLVAAVSDERSSKSDERSMDSSDLRRMIWWFDCLQTP